MNNSDLIHLYIRNNVNLNFQQSPDEHTPLSAAAEAGHIDIVNTLVASGVDSKVKINGKTALELTVDKISSLRNYSPYTGGLHAFPSPGA